MDPAFDDVIAPGDVCEPGLFFAYANTPNTMAGELASQWKLDPLFADLCCLVKVTNIRMVNYYTSWWNGLYPVSLFEHADVKEHRTQELWPLRKTRMKNTDMVLSLSKLDGKTVCFYFPASDEVCWSDVDEYLNEAFPGVPRVEAFPDVVKVVCSK